MVRFFFILNILSLYLLKIKKISNCLVYKKPGLTPGRGQNIATCNYDKPPGKGKVCDVDVKAFDLCTEEHRFHFDRQAPCIFLKLNKVRSSQSY